MKRIALIFACLLMILSTVFCAGCAEQEGVKVADKKIALPNLNITEIGKNVVHGGYYYIVDNNTKVVYLANMGAYSNAMAAMLKPDGTPLLAKDLGLEEYLN